MSPVPIVYRGPGAINATYSFLEIASGTGYITLYGGVTINTSALYRLSSVPYYGDIEKSSANTTSALATKIIDLDFDVPINSRMNVKGTAIVNITKYYVTSGGGESYVIAKLRKYDGSETDIASGQGSTTAHAEQPHTSAIDITVPETIFKKGDTLRVTIELWALSATAPTVATFGIYTDPMNRGTSATIDTTVFNIQLPIKVEL